MRVMLKKKRFLFPLIFLGELVVIIAIANIFGLETENSLFGLISAYILFTTILILLIRISKDHKATLTSIKLPALYMPIIWGVYFVIGLLTFLLIIILPAALTDLLS